LTHLGEVPDVARVLLTAMWYGAGESEISEALAAAAESFTRLKDGSVSIQLGYAEIQESDAVQRQRAFELANEDLLRRASLASLSTTLEGRSGMILWVTLDPTDGNAGIVLTPSITSSWSSLGVEIFFSAMRQD